MDINKNSKMNWMIVKSSLIREINNSQFVLLILEYINIYNIFLFQTIRSFDH